MAARKKAATETTPVQTEEIVNVEETDKVEKKAAKATKTTKAKAEKEEKAEKKPAAKRTTKKAVKTTFVVQAGEKEVSMEEAVARVKEAWVAAGNVEKDLKEIAVYVKPEDNAIYYVVNGDVTGKVEF